VEKIICYGLKTPIIQPGDDIVQIIIDTIETNKLQINDGDVIVIAETPLAISQNRIIKLESVKPSDEAEKLAKKYYMEPNFVELILNEADKILGGVNGVLLTEKNGFIHANAGVDKSNAPPGFVVLLPKNLQETADNIRKKLQGHFKKKLAIIIADSRTQPLKKGVIGGALAVSGMEPIEDCRNKEDLYGYKLKYTYRAIADDLSSLAQLLFGETNQQIPVAIIQGAKITLTEKSKENMLIPKDQCLFMSILEKEKSGPKLP